MSLIQNQQLLPNQANMVIFTQIVRVSRRDPLQIDDIAPLVRASDSLDLDAPSDLDWLSSCVLNFVYCQIHSSAELCHRFMELRIALDRLLLVDCAIFRERG